MLKWFPDVPIYALGQEEFKSHWHKVSCRPQSTVLLDDYLGSAFCSVGQHLVNSMGVRRAAAERAEEHDIGVVRIADPVPDLEPWAACAT